jgi:glycosyltransferase involved in cell wall biosynthesis
MNPEISVILCTHNPREDYLRRTLDGLDGQTLDKNRWEFLLVDNASDPPLPALKVWPGFLGWHSIQEDGPGQIHARVRGIKESSGDLLVFVDQDNVLAPDYLEQALVVSREWPFIGAWSGDIKPEYESPLPEWVKDQVWRLTVMEVGDDSWSNLRDSTTMPVGSGLCIRREVALKFVQWCQEHPQSRLLGRQPGHLYGYDDTALASCSFDLGLGVGRSKRLRLTHLIESSRLTQEYFDRHAKESEESLKLFKELRGMK